MLGVNLVFAGFALTLNGVSYFIEMDGKAKGIANLLVGIIIAINAVFQTAQATNPMTFGFAAAMWLFALNYFVLAAHMLLGAANWKVFGMYALFAAITSFVFAGESIYLGAPVAMIYMWLMWGVLWGQSALASLFGIKAIDKISPHVLILNGIASTFVPGFLILMGIIL